MIPTEKSRTRVCSGNPGSQLLTSGQAKRFEDRYSKAINSMLARIMDK
jgi:hypothetical protein